MKNFNKARISYCERVATLQFAESEPNLKMVEVEAILDVSRDDIPVGIELFHATELGNENLASVRSALCAAELRFSYDSDENILTININAIDEDATSQRPGRLQFRFSTSGQLISLMVI